MVKAADLDGDGRPDLVVPNWSDDTISVFLQSGSGGGVFLAPVTYATGTTPSSVAIGDLDGDGRLDLVVTNYGSNTITIFLQDPLHPGQFLAQPPIVVGSRPHRAAIADLDGDGKLDIVVAVTDAGVSVLLQDPATPGSFPTVQSFAAGSQPTDVAVGDFDGDGRLDLVVADYATSDLALLLQDPANPGSFLAPTLLSGHGTVNGMTVGDLDGDGALDVVIANRETNDVSIWFGDGAGGFSPRLDVAASSHPWDVKIADMSRDGTRDLVVTGFGSEFGSPDVDSSVLVLLQQPGALRTFVAGPAYKAGANPDFAVVTDLDGDGVLDLAVSNWASGDVTVLLSIPTPGPQWVPRASASLARSDLGAAVGPDGLVSFVGGRTPTQQSLVETYDPAADSWATRASLSTARSGVCVATGSDGLIYAIGGEDGSALATVEAYDTNLDRWVNVASLSTPRISAAAALGPDGLVYVAGGYSGSPGQVTTALASVEAYDPGPGSWSTRAPLATPRAAPALATGLDGRIYAFGGLDTSGDVLRSVEAYDPAHDSWAPVSPMPTARWVAAAVTALDGRIYVLGGDTGSPSSSSDTAAVEAFDPATGTWATFPSLSTPRRGPAAALCPDGRVLVACGTSSVSYLSSAEAFGPSVALAPSAGAAGTLTTVSGNHFAPGAAVPIYWGDASSGTLLGTASTDAGGAFASVRVMIPPAATSGAHSLTLVDPATGYRVRASFTVP